MDLNPSGSYNVDCYVDANFVGLWGVENDQDPLCVKSRSEFHIMLMSYLLLWISKLQTQLALSTMESEYIALSHAMRELIALRGIPKEMYEHILVDTSNIKPQYSTIHKYGKIP